MEKQKKSTETLKVSWSTKKVQDRSRVNAMYCFKSCEKHPA